MDNPQKKIYLQKIGEIDSKILKDLKKGLRKKFEKFDLSVIVPEKSLPLLESEYNVSRKQYDGSKIINRLLDYSMTNQYFRTLGVLDKDIYSNGLNFVFGIATPPNNEITRNFGVSIISTIRLREEFYDHVHNDELFSIRTLKEAVHELGHTFGLKHCNNYCIMRFSNYLGHTDEKPVDFCDACSEQISFFLDNMNFKK